MELYIRLKQVRREHKISQEELAERMEVSRQTISKWETGAVQPSAENLRRLSEVYGIPVDALLKDGPQAAGPAPAPPGKTWKPDARPFWVPVVAAVVLAAAVFLGAWIAWSLSQEPIPLDQLPNEEVDISAIEGVEIIPLP